VAASTPFVRSLLRNLWAEAQSANITLLAKLTATNASAVTAVSSGKVLQSTSGNGRSVTFTVNGTEGITPTQLVEVMDRLLNLYDAAVAAGNSSDSARYAYMLAALRPVTTYHSKFQTLLR